MANVSGDPPFSYLFYDAVTGALQGMLPLSAPKLSSILNAPGTWNATVDLTDPKVQAMNPIGVTTPGRTIMCVDYNGALIYGGLVSTRKWSHKTRKLTLGGKEIWEWFSLRNQWSDYQTVPTQPTGASMQYWTAATWDASMIAAQVVSDALAPPITLTGTTDGTTGVITGISTPGIMYGMPVSGTGVPIGSVVVAISAASVMISQATTVAATSALTFGLSQNNLLGGLQLLVNGAAPSTWAVTPPSSSANWISPTYPWTSLSTVDSIVTQLSRLGLNIGCDFGVDVAYASGPGSVPVATINLSYPRRGRTVANNNLVLDLSSSAVSDYEFPEDATGAGSTQFQMGGTAGGLANAYANPYPTNQGYPLTEQVGSASNIVSSSVLLELSQAASAFASYPLVAATVTMDAFGGNPVFGDFIVGDDIQILLPALDQDGQVFDPRFPNGLNEEWRITQYDLTVNDEGIVEMMLTLQLPPQIIAVGPAI